MPDLTPTRTRHGTPSFPQAEGEMTRRNFLRTTAVAASGIAAMSAILAPLRELTDFPSLEQFLQKHYQELTPPEMEKVLDRITREVSAVRFGRTCAI